MKRFLPWSGLKVWLVLSAMFVSSRSHAQVKDESCQATCGDIQIPYPFGIGGNCSLSESFSLNCSHSNSKEPQLFTDGVELESINLESSQVQALASISYQCYKSGSSNYSNAEYEKSNPTGNYSKGPKSYMGQNQFSYDKSDPSGNSSKRGMDLYSSPYRFSYEENVFIGVGCDTLAYIYDSEGTNYIGGCITVCSSKNNIDNGSCSGTSCCQTSIQPGMRNYSLDFSTWSNHSRVLNFNPCSYGFIVMKNYYNFTTSDLEYMDPNQKFPVVLDWAIGSSTCEEAQRNKTGYACVAENSDCSNSTNGSGYVCKCSTGYTGNPYLQNGCEDIDECKEQPKTCKGVCANTIGSYTCTCPPGTIGNATGDGCTPKGNPFSTWAKLGLGIGVGLPLLFIIGSCIFWVFQKRKLTKLKEDLFRQNGGLSLKEKILREKIDTFSIFTMSEMEHATNKFDTQRILGRGGNGIVYKGFLHDGTPVAIKKSLIVEASKNMGFANEMIILSKVNHVNIVRLLGCCLEVEIPMLVYEYISNGTLSEQIHSSSIQEHRIPWDLRLKIGAESAKALSYLHSEASPPILHGDIKSTNILLSENFTAKVSDFGTSTFAPKDKSRFMTIIQGTYGYLDPEYLQTGDLTDKSDVYSFGVVMVELLTGKKVIYKDDEDKEKNLVFEFISCMKEGRLMDVLDPRIKDCNNESSSNSLMMEIKVVADVVMQCLSMIGEERPTMSHVSKVLEGLRTSEPHPWVQQRFEEMESLIETKRPAISSSNLNEYSTINTSEIEMKNIGSGR